MDWLKKLMYGRYGGDNLSRALLILSIVLLIAGDLLPKPLSNLMIIAYITVLVCIYRIFSKNIFRRQRENYQYLKMKSSVTLWFQRKLKRVKDLKTYKYFTCPNCRQKLRVPRKQGTISITCPKCKSLFKGKS